MWALTFRKEFQVAELTPAMEVYLNSSPHLESEYRNTFTDKQYFKRIPLSLTVSGSTGKPLVVTATDDRGNTAIAQSKTPLQKATTSPITERTLAAELGALGGTVFTLQHATNNLSDSCFIHTRELKEIRRSLSDQLEQQRMDPFSVETKTPEEMQKWLLQTKVHQTKTREPSHLNVLVREIEQLGELQELPLHTVYLDFEFGKEYAAAAERVRQYGYRVGIATTRIFKPGELGHLKVIERIKPDEVLVRNLGALQHLRSTGLTLIGDFSLNVTNSLTAQWFISKGVSRITPSYDLNGEQLLELANTVTAATLEITAQHYIPAFHMEHCVFAAFLSSGSSYKDCGRPCEKHRVELRDPKGGLHPLKADAECRNTMFNGYSQSVASLFPQLKEAGVATYRIEALFESAIELRQKIVAYADLLHNRASPDETIARVGAVEKIGVTDGQLYNIRKYSDRKKPFTALADLADAADPGLKAVLSS
jgi:putative protease